MATYVCFGSNKNNPWDKSFLNLGYVTEEGDSELEAAEKYFKRFPTATQVALTKSEWTTYKPTVVAVSEDE